MTGHLVLIALLAAPCIGQQENRLPDPCLWPDLRRGSKQASDLLDQVGKAGSFETDQYFLHISNDPRVKGRAVARQCNNQHWILYDRDYFDALFGKANGSNAVWLILAHEASHHQDGHTSLTMMNSLTDEAYSWGSTNEGKADRRAGEYMANYGFTRPQVEAAFNAAGIPQSAPGYPTRDQRLRAVLAGYDGKRNPVSAIAGSQWRARPSGTPEDLTSICGTPDGNHLWAVGDRGNILQTDDAGETWRTRTGQDLNTFNLYSIFCTADGRHLWAAGENFMNRVEREKGVILQSDDGGATWKVSKSGVTGALHSIFGTPDGRHLWAVSGVFNWNGAVIVQSDDSGGTWQARTGWNASNLNSIFCTADGNHLWVVGALGASLKSDDAGVTWKTGAIEALVNTSYDMHSVFGTSDGRHLWVVGGNDDGGYPEVGIILQSDDGGATWQMQKPSGSGKFHSIFGTPDGKHLWAVGGYQYGSEGTIAQSDDGGATWQVRKLGRSPHNAPFRMNSIFGIPDGKHLWAVGKEGTILQSDASLP